MENKTFTNGNKTATVKKSTNGYGEETYYSSVIQTYNNGFETVERFIGSKHYKTEKAAINFAKKLLK